MLLERPDSFLHRSKLVRQTPIGTCYFTEQAERHPNANVINNFAVDLAAKSSRLKRKPTVDSLGECRVSAQHDKTRR